MKALILIWSLLLPYMALGQATSSDTQYRNDGETLINGSFEQGKKGYTLSVGSGSLVWSTQSTTSLNGKAMQLTLSAQTFSFKSATTQGSKLTGQNGYVEVYLSANNSGAEICPLVDGVSAPTTTPNECQPIIAGVGFKPYGIQKVFGATSLNYEIRGVSNASYTGVIYADDGSVAKKSIVTQISGSELVGTISWAPIAGCVWSFPSSVTYVSPSAVPACNNPVVTGKIRAPSTKVPAFDIDVKAGTYTIVFTGGLVNSGGNTKSYRFFDGASGTFGASALGSAFNSLGAFTAQITYSTSSTKTLAIQGLDETAGGSSLYNDNASRATAFSIYYTPPQPISTINTSGGWFIDANIGGPNATFTTIRSSYTEMSGSSYDMVINTSKGSANAEIPCQSTQPSSGLTCSGGFDETLGIVFTPPKTGKFRVCVYGAVSIGVGGNGIFQLIETPNNAQTILQEGGSRIDIQSASTSAEHNISHCSNFTFNDTTKKTIRLMHEKTNGASMIPLTDRDASSGQRDFHFTVEPIVENIQASLQGYNHTDGTINIDTFSFSYGGTTLSNECSSGTCLLEQIGDYVLSVIYQSTSSNLVTLKRTYSKLKCLGNYRSTVGGAMSYNQITCTNCSSFSANAVINFSGGSSYTNNLATIFCQGQY